jgi:AcrR family transcriptional regulator
MPSKTFYNLDKNKQDKLVEAALKEFSNSSYYNASINKIIKDANISRGSFYMYFVDKEDLFSYLFSKHRERINEMTEKALIDSNGKLDKAFIELYKDSFNNIKGYQYKQFFINTFAYLNSRTEHFVKPSAKEIDKLVSLIDKNSIKEDPYILLSMLMQNLIATIAKDNLLDDKKRLERYITRVNIICYGGCK